ncbi:hypothetical protein HDU78_006698 [Chytriomyces hyalinus]|nr:hypothetical protein HDU78_006698 [Chytriomyces hyalinus]
MGVNAKTLLELACNNSCGAIVHGQSGVGKSRMLQEVRQRVGPVSSFWIDCDDHNEQRLGELSNWLMRSTGESKYLLMDNANSVLRTSSTQLLLKEMLLNVIDGTYFHPVAVILATSLSPKDFDISLTRSGRLGTVLCLETKYSADREIILKSILEEMKIETSKFSFLGEFCDSAHGLVAGDLKHIVDSLLVTRADVYSWGLSDFKAELKDSTTRMKPLNPPRPFDKFFGMNDILNQVMVSVIEPWRSVVKSASRTDDSSAAPRGVLICGPPGVGKTQFGMAIAQQIGFNQVIVNGSEVRSKIVGESEENIRRIFADARRKSPCVLFIDQLDALTPIRGSDGTSENSGNRIVTSFLTEMDGVISSQLESHLLILAVTNRKEAIDPAILRPGRVNEFIVLRLPNEIERAQIFEGFLDNVPHSISPEQVIELASLTKDCSGAIIENYCREAAYVCMRTSDSEAKITFSIMKKVITQQTQSAEK